MKELKVIKLIPDVETMTKRGQHLGGRKVRKSRFFLLQKLGFSGMHPLEPAVSQLVHSRIGAHKTNH